MTRARICLDSSDLDSNTLEALCSFVREPFCEKTPWLGVDYYLIRIAFSAIPFLCGVVSALASTGWYLDKRTLCLVLYGGFSSSMLVFYWVFEACRNLYVRRKQRLIWRTYPEFALDYLIAHHLRYEHASLTWKRRQRLFIKCIALAACALPLCMRMATIFGASTYYKIRMVRGVYHEHTMYYMMSLAGAVCCTGLIVGLCLLCGSTARASRQFQRDHVRVSSRAPELFTEEALGGAVSLSVDGEEEAGKLSLF